MFSRTSRKYNENIKRCKTENIGKLKEIKSDIEQKKEKFKEKRKERKEK